MVMKEKSSIILVPTGPTLEGPQGQAGPRCDSCWEPPQGWSPLNYADLQAQAMCGTQRQGREGPGPVVPDSFPEVNDGRPKVSKLVTYEADRPGTDTGP